MRMALDAWNASGSLVPECVAKHSQEPWLCFFPEYFGQWLPPNVPLMVAQRRLEPFALKLYAGLGPKQEVSEDVRAALVPRVKASLEAVRCVGVLDAGLCSVATQSPRFVCLLATQPRTPPPPPAPLPIYIKRSQYTGSPRDTGRQTNQFAQASLQSPSGTITYSITAEAPLQGSGTTILPPFGIQRR